MTNPNDPKQGSSDAASHHQMKNLDVRLEPLVPTNQLFSIIPKFSETTNNLNTFIRHCRQVQTYASGFQKQLLLPTVISQLEGKAASLANRKNFENLDSLLSELQNHFGKVRSISEILLDSQQSRQRGSVAKFVEYYEKLRNELFSNEKFINDKAGILSKEYDELLMNNFIIGLESQCFNRISAKDPVNLDEAFRFALEAERKLEFYNKHNCKTEKSSSNKNSSYRTSNNDNRYNKNYSVQTERKPISKNVSTDRYCTHCKMNGHTIEYCRKLQPSTSYSEKHKNNNTSSTQKVNSLNTNAEDVNEQSSSEEETDILGNLLNL